MNVANQAFEPDVSKWDAWTPAEAAELLDADALELVHPGHAWLGALEKDSR
jgi:hypothetical protein